MAMLAFGAATLVCFLTLGRALSHNNDKNKKLQMSSRHGSSGVGISGEAGRAEIKSGLVRPMLEDMTRANALPLPTTASAPRLGPRRRLEPRRTLQAYEEAQRRWRRNLQQTPQQTCNEGCSADLFGMDYRGCQSTTIQGYTCQRWDSQLPHAHEFSPQNFPLAGLDENYCRNPVGFGYVPWCFTTDPNMLWDFCNVVSCKIRKNGFACFDFYGLDLFFAIRGYLNQDSDILSTYGPVIGDWCVDHVQQFDSQFANLTAFNQPLTNWNTSAATSMSFMFYNSSFNQPVSHFETKFVTNFALMFGVMDLSTVFGNGTTGLFNQPLTGWDTSSALSMSGMFFQAARFNQPVAHFNVGNVLDFSGMFAAALKFNQPLTGWTTSWGAAIHGMFLMAQSFNQPVAHLSVTGTTNLFGVLATYGPFNQPLTGWDTSFATSMYGMLSGNAQFNQPLSHFVVNRVQYFDFLFWGCQRFNQPLDTWDTSAANNMTAMLYDARSFDQPLSHFRMENVRDTSFMLYGTKSLNRPLTGWSTGSVISMRSMFYNSSFNQPLPATFTVDRVFDFGFMFAYTPYQHPLPHWRTLSAQRMDNMFLWTPYNQDVSHFITDNVWDFRGMFALSAFNQPLNGWSTTSAMTMESMFAASPYNQDLSTFDVDRVVEFNHTFAYSAFNRPLDTWNTSSARSMVSMFNTCPFNHPIVHFDVRQVVDMRYMFCLGGFNQNLCSWGQTLHNTTTLVDAMFVGSPCAKQNDPQLSNAVPGPFCKPCINATSASNCRGKNKLCKRHGDCCGTLKCQTERGMQSGLMMKARAKKKCTRNSRRGGEDENQQNNIGGTQRNECYAVQNLADVCGCYNKKKQVKNCVAKQIEKSTCCDSIKAKKCEKTTRKASKLTLEWCEDQTTSNKDPPLFGGTNNGVRSVGGLFGAPQQHFKLEPP